MSAATPTEPIAIKALVVDDDPMGVLLLSAFLEGRGYTVENAGDGLEALDRLASGDFNVVITDREMPRMDGVSLCREIRARARNSYVYCIMLTASSDEASLVTAMEAGVDDFLGKPLRPAELGARLHAAERVLALEAGLASRNRRLAEAHAQLSRELDLARSMQLGLLPAPADFGRVRFDWLFEASSYVGGDTLDYFPLGERHLCFYLIDVSGHGVSAAMMAFNAQHQLLGLSQQVGGPMLKQGQDLAATAVAVVTEYNRRFMQMKETSLYLTMVYGLLDTTTWRAALVQAGHPPPLYAQPGSNAFAPVGDGGLPIGVVANAQYDAYCVAMDPGARLILYSDGATECSNARGAAYGEERLLNVVAAQRAMPLADTGDALHRELVGWRNGEAFEDDVTVLALEVR